MNTGTAEGALRRDGLPGGGFRPWSRSGRLLRRLQGRPCDLAVAGLAALDVTFSLPSLLPWQTALSFLAAGSLLLRRRFPRLVLALTLPGLFAGVALLAAIVALGTLARRRRFDRQVGLAVALVVAGSFVPWPLSTFAETPPGTLTQWLLYSLLLGVGPAVVGLLAQTRQDLSERVAELATLRDHERELHARTVLAREHARLAREMHDVISHRASLIAVQAGALEVTTRDPRVKETAGTLRTLATGTLEELRGMIVVLRAAGAGPTSLVPQPRLADLPELVAQSGRDTRLTVTGADGRSLPEAAERTAYRIVQEALTNARKHAPGAPATVTVDVARDTLRIAVRNPAPATGAVRPRLPAGGHGIRGLQERAALLGGRLTAAPTADGGFEVRGEVPLTNGAGREAGAV